GLAATGQVTDGVAQLVRGTRTTPSGAAVLRFAPVLGHRFTVPRSSADAPTSHMGAALLAALRCSLIGSPCLVPRPMHRPPTWELRSSLRCGARSSVHRASFLGRGTDLHHGTCAPRLAAVLALESVDPGGAAAALALAVHRTPQI